MPIGTYREKKMTPTQQWKAYALDTVMVNAGLMDQKLSDTGTIDNLEKQNKELRAKVRKLRQAKEI